MWSFHSPAICFVCQEIELKCRVVCHREKKQKKERHSFEFGWLAYLVLDEGVDIVASVVELCSDETLKSARSNTLVSAFSTPLTVTKRC